MNNSEKLNYLISHAMADINLCAYAFFVISEADSNEKAKLLEEFIIGFQQTPSDCELKLQTFMDKDELQRFRHRYGKMVDSYLEELIELSLPKPEFYTKLWNYIQNSSELTTQKLRVFALFNIVIDKRVPYFMIDRKSMLSMDNDQFTALNNQVGDEAFGELEYILKSKFNQKTEQASLVVKMLEALPEFKLKTVFIVRLIAFYERKIAKMCFSELFNDD